MKLSHKKSLLGVQDDICNLQFLCSDIRKSEYDFEVIKLNMS